MQPGEYVLGPAQTVESTMKWTSVFEIGFSPLEESFTNIPSSL